IARLFLKTLFVVNCRRTLQRHRGDFYAWDGRAFLNADEESLKAKLYGFLDQCVAPSENGHRRPVKPNMRMVGNVLDALAAASQLDSTITAPAWLDSDANLHAQEIISCTNGLLHLPTLTLLPHTPAFFTHSAVDFVYDVNADEPLHWVQFLRQLWPD